MQHNQICSFNVNSLDLATVSHVWALCGHIAENDDQLHVESWEIFTPNLKFLQPSLLELGH